MVNLQTYPPAELPPINSVGSIACHLLFPCHCYHFTESFQRQFPHFLWNHLFFRSSQTGALTCCHASGFFRGFFELVLFFPWSPRPFNYFLMFFWPSSWTVLHAFPCLWPYLDRLWAGYKAVAHPGCQNRSLSDCKTSVTPSCSSHVDCKCEGTKFNIWLCCR